MRRSLLRASLLRRVAFATALAVAPVGLVATIPVVGAEAAPVQAAQTVEPAAPAAPFVAGSIITDPLFYDFGTMTAADIQDFLEAQVPECSPSSEAPCLRDYVTDTKSIDAVSGRCANDIRRADDQTAAQVIFTIARACEVNPQVLLVTLQKEQGLVTADSVATLKYRKAMGYGCPDTAECATKYYGFFQQVYWAARAFHAYSAAPAAFRYQPGDRDRVAYSPKAGCGSTLITMQNRATAALYNYTPYTPNEASLANPYEEGDDCSSYGNRNFWLYFNSWFGDSSLGQYLVTSRGTTWLVVGRDRWRMTSGAPQLGSALRALGLRGEVSAVFLESLHDRGALTPIVQVEGNGDRFYLLGAGVKYAIDGCDRVSGFGFSCTVPVFRASVLKSYKRSGDLQFSSAITASATDGSLYLLGPNGSRSEILDRSEVSGTDATGPVIPVDTAVIGRIPVANPVARPGALATNPVTGAGYYLPADGTTTLVIDRSFLLSTDAPDWFGGIDGELARSSIDVLPDPLALPPLFRSGGVSYLVGADGKIPVADPGEWASAFTPLDSRLADLIPLDPDFASAPATTPAIVAPTAGDQVFKVSAGQRSPAAGNAGDAIRLPAITLRAISLAP